MTLYKSKIVLFPHFFAIQSKVKIDSDFLGVIQKIVDSTIPEQFWIEMKAGAGPEAIFKKLSSQLPLFQVSDITPSSSSFSIAYLCPAEYTHRARRYVLDILRKWLISPKQIEVTGGISLIFQFTEDPKRSFLIARELISIRSKEELLLVRKNLPDLIAQLKEQLPCEFLRHSDNSVHPIFMPRNEEEMIRGLIVLASQIKYVRDLPQVSIHFEKQTDTHLTFTVLVARLLKSPAESLRNTLEKSRFKMDIDDVRTMGYLKKQKYPKEAALLRVNIAKRPFFRPDYSVDLLKARQKIASNLAHCLGKFRDFNGGMILKQDEALKHLRDLIGNLPQKEEFLLENYFYALRPAVMQTVHESHILKRHFHLLRSLLKTDGKIQMKQKLAGKFYLCFFRSRTSYLKEAIFDAIRPLGISSRNLTSSFFEFDRKFFLGFILRVESTELSHQFARILKQTLNDLKRREFNPIQ